MDIIIAKHVDGRLMFYSAGSWSAEYPDATIYNNSVNARKMANRLIGRGDRVSVIGDYGLDSEKVIG